MNINRYPMLVEFRVSNFRSIREEQRLSLVANSDKSHSETHVIRSDAKSGISLLKSAVIYGANASGKSTLIMAMAFMKRIVAESATHVKEGQKFFLQSFKLDGISSTKPSEFEITFIEAGIRYQYGFSLLPDRITSEWLLVYKTSKPQVWFDRRYNAETNVDEYTFSPFLSGEKKLWQKSTRSNSLFLSKAVDLNSNALRPVFLWIVQQLHIIGAGEQPMIEFSTAFAQLPEGKRQLLDFLSAADLSISELSLEIRQQREVSVRVEGEKPPVHQVIDSEALMPIFLHTGAEGAAKFEFHDESTGTQRLFAFAGPILDVLREGSVLIVDELDGSLHTKIVRFLLSIINSSMHNTEGAQLIFTTHDTSVMDAKLFRRDQIWFVEKDKSHATHLYPLTDFSPRTNEALEKGYLVGRYGAIPFINETMF